MTLSHVDPPAAPQPAPVRSARKWTIGSSTFEAILGGVTIVLAIVGLAGLIATSLAAVAAIGIGVALLANARTMKDHFRQGFEAALARNWNSTPREGLRVEAVGGVLGVTLGILALVGVAPFELLSANTIVMGIVMLFAGAVSVDVDATAFEMASETRKRQTEELFMASSTGRIVVAVATIMLGTLALNNIAHATTYVLVSQLVIGTVVLLSGGAIARWTKKVAA